MQHTSLRVQPGSDTHRSQLSKNTKGIDRISMMTATGTFPRPVPAPRRFHQSFEHVDIALSVQRHIVSLVRACLLCANLRPYAPKVVPTVTTSAVSPYVYCCMLS